VRLFVSKSLDVPMTVKRNSAASDGIGSIPVRPKRVNVKVNMTCSHTIGSIHALEDCLERTLRVPVKSDENENAKAQLSDLTKE